MRSRIEKFDGKINANVQYQMLIEVEKTLKVAVEWLVNDANEEMIKNNLEMFNKLASNISRNLKGYLKTQRMPSFSATTRGVSQI